ncbi:hypothetical protein BDV95DRAFT_511296 [Massariosphaeria phaeospora]|uniref:Capsule polysaccharide biosynthesis protein n=1 Tax=Massariosphaeria phaeospora TaxID=100035 RepID=A0A7C8IEB1_9PLEO|nr:hypothetical protein BDV95DRAFT_511296 [Massariosphaeria phaeospora]
MSGSKIPIPEEFASQLKYVDAKDSRTDAEILDALSKHVPIKSEKNVWTYWHSGVLTLPGWCQRTVLNWVRLLGPDWTVRVLDKVPNSPNHALNWIDPEELPESFVDDTMTGPYVGPHSADFLRGAALFAYGGVWMDVGNVLFTHLDKICWDQLADKNSPFTVCAPWSLAQQLSNHFVAARKGDPFIKKWHELFIHFWKGRKDYIGVIDSPLISFIKNFDYAEVAARGLNFEFAVDEQTTMGYLGQVVAWVRLAWLKEPNGGFDGVEYYANKVLCFDVLTENWAAETIVGFKGEDLYKVFATRRDADPESDAYKKAYKTAWRLLTQSSLQKITRSKGISVHKGCGMFFDEHQGQDDAPGTFGELLRYGSVHFEQTRDKLDYVKAVRPDPAFIIHKGLLEH